MRVKLINRIFIYIVISIFLLFALFPIMWIISTSFKNPTEAVSIPPTWIPERITFNNYVRIWGMQPMLRFFLNSLIVSISTIIVSVLAGALTAYGISRFRLKYKNIILTIILLTQMVPGVLLIVPYFILMKNFHLLNTYLSLIIAYTSFTLPVVTWILMGFFETIPRALDEAALIDGCSRISVFFRIILPLSTPALVSTMIFTFIVSWTEYLFPLVLISKREMLLMTTGIASFIGQFRISWGELMAAGVVSILPILIIFSFLDKYLIEGLTRGSVKG